jgi:hypothetical protein
MNAKIFSYFKILHVVWKKMFMRFKRCFYGFYKKDHEFKKCSQVQKLFFDSENMFTNLIKCLLLLGIEKGVDPRL